MDTTVNKGEDYLQRYRDISAKLKKRFLRKPNVAEASEEFSALQRSLVESEVWTGAGLCSVATARCQRTLGAPHAEAQAITQAARYYIKAEQASLKLLCPSYGDHLLTATSCYRRAIALHSANSDTWQEGRGSTTAATEGGGGSGGRKAMEGQLAEPSEGEHREGDNIVAAALSLELATALQECEHCAEALPVLLSAAQLLQGCPVQQLHVLQSLQELYILLGDLDGSLKTSARVLDVAWQQQVTSLEGREQQQGDRRLSSLPAGFRDVVSRCEVLSLLLLLLLQPLPQRTPLALQRLLGKYSEQGCGGAADAPFSSPELLCLLRCLAMASRSSNWETVQQLSEPLTQHLLHLPLHLHLLHLLATEVDRG